MLLAALLLACHPPRETVVSDADADADVDTDADADADTDADVDTHSGPTVHSGLEHSGVPSPSVSASCQVQPDNALRVDCHVEVQPPGPVEVSFQPSAGGAARIQRWDEVGRADLTLWRMNGDTDHDYVFTALDSGAEASGTFRSGRIPAAFQVSMSVTGVVPPAGDLLFQADCDVPTAVVVDGEGRMVWYQDLTAGLPAGAYRVQATDVAGDGGVVSMLDRSLVRWFDWDGTLRLEAGAGITPGFDRAVHHDVAQRDGLLWVLTAEAWSDAVASWVVDGFYVLDTSGAVVADWNVDALAPPSGPGFAGYWGGQFAYAIDWTHENSVEVDENHDLLLSFLQVDTVIQVHGDPADPAFGQAVTTLVGDDATTFVSDYTIADPHGLTSDLTFSHQHHPHWLPSGELQMFDNEEIGASRVLRLRLDASARTAEITGSWSLGVACAYAGSAYDRADGTLIATCAPSGTFSVIEPTSGDVLGTWRPRCVGGGSRAMLARGIPVTL
ncbi:MAG: aryl-sulfate sulfotransferase [Myxococcales bacterium]|nr:aryl-sulfate sulfotransferase [Myxococcales bacterium]